MLFYKGLLRSELRETGFIPGSVAVNCKEAAQWRDRIRSNKKSGAARHVRHGDAVVIAFEFDEKTLKGPEAFQASGVTEHARENCWMSSTKSKAQINQPIAGYRILTDDEVFEIARM